jgi:hypothetical protein
VLTGEHRRIDQAGHPRLAGPVEIRVEDGDRRAAAVERDGELHGE